MSNTREFAALIPAREEDIDEVVSFYNREIEAINDDPRRMTQWSPFTPNQVADIIDDPHSKLLVMREKLGEVAMGKVAGGVILDKKFTAWAPQELLSPEPWHFAKFLATHTIKRLGSDALWPALLDYAEENGASALYAEAWDFRYDGLPDDNLRKYYTDLGMEWHGTVIYRNDYYGEIIGRDRPVNRFMYELLQK